MMIRDDQLDGVIGVIDNPDVDYKLSAFLFPVNGGTTTTFFKYKLS
jgi:hypothetical protein